MTIVGSVVSLMSGLCVVMLSGAKHLAAPLPTQQLHMRGIPPPSFLDASNDCGLYATGDLTNTDSVLGLPRRVNGQVVNTLQPAIPAIDAGDDSQCPATDATGFPRPYGVHCDIDAYEWRPMEFTFLPFAIKWRLPPVATRLRFDV